MIGFLLGAGFSVNAGIPTVNGISKRFLNIPLDEHVLNFSSGEWKWDEWANEVETENGKLGGSRIQICMLMDLLIPEYLEENKTDILQYEAFYGYVRKTLNNIEKMQCLSDKAKRKYIEQRPYLEKYNLLESNSEIEKFDNINDYEINSFFFHLIADLLYLHSPLADYVEKYYPFLSILKRSGYNADIFSLNHDLLVETLLHNKGIPFSNGFTTTASDLVSDSKAIIPVFRDFFVENIRLHKLHGGLDIYRYDYVRDENKHLRHDYFLTSGFYEKQLANHCVDGKTIQNFTPDVRPQFITGTDKLAVIQSDGMYSALHSRFKSKLNSLKELYLIGYSYGDEYINEILSESINSIELIVNVNPFDKFSLGDRAKVIELSDISELARFG